MEWREQIPEDMPPQIGLLTGIRRRINVLLAALRALANMQGRNGVRVQIAGLNIVVDGAELQRAVAALQAEVDTVTGVDRTFFSRGNGTANVVVSAGAVGSVIVPATTITAPANAARIYLWVQIDGAGIVTAAEVRSGSSIPADTSTQGHKPLATVAVASSIATPTPVSWNWTDVQICGGVWLWGGIAS